MHRINQVIIEGKIVRQSSDGFAIDLEYTDSEKDQNFEINVINKLGCTFENGFLYEL